MVRPQPHPSHTRGTFHRRLQPLYKENTQGFVPKLSCQNKARATSTLPFQCVLKHHITNPHLSTHMATQHSNSHAGLPLRSATTEVQEAHRTTHALRNTHCRAQEEEPIAPGSTAAAHTRYLSSSAAATLYTRKNTRFCAETTSQSEAPATSMQPLQCVLQHPVANPHLSTHMATQHDNIHAAILLRSAIHDSKSPYLTATHQHAQGT